MGAEAVLLYNNPLLPRAEASNNLELLATGQAWQPWVCGGAGNSSSFHRGSSVSNLNIPSKTSFSQQLQNGRAVPEFTLRRARV